MIIYDNILATVMLYRIGGDVCGTEVRVEKVTATSQRRI